MKLIIVLLIIVALLFPCYGYGQEKSCDKPCDTKASTCDKAPIPEKKPLDRITISTDLKLTGNRADDISNAIKSKLADAGIKLCPKSGNYLTGEFVIIPPSSQYPYVAQIYLKAESPFCTTYDLAYFSLKATLIIGKDPAITNEQIDLLAEQIVNNFILRVKERDALYNKK